MSNIRVSVIMPIYNEEDYIRNCVDSLLLQDYPKEKMEWIFVDGNSSDNTKNILLEYQKKYPDLIKIMLNPKKTVPYAMNIGIKESIGEYIVRLDAHADYSQDYISKCVYYLDTIEADNVGGIAITKSRTRTGKYIAKLLSSKFGVGNSQFRTFGKSRYVDTVPFGAFRRELFDRIGLYNEKLTRNQDNELNYRIRKNGGKIYLANDISFSYYCRDNLKSLCKMAFNNGKWNIITTKIMPGSMGIRHFIPMIFVLSLVFLIILSFFWKIALSVLIIELIAYFLLNIYFSIIASDSLSSFFQLVFMFFIFHVSYGIGSIAGFFSKNDL